MPRHIAHLRIAGRVQGVGFRAFVEAEARARGLEGWVRNRRDGSVEAVLAGARETVDEMTAACWRGPPASRVTAVSVAAADGAALAQRRAGEAFSVLPTA